uniref:Venom allergen-1 n=1 Tax=Anopheles atroparvus TaxID=41427 RepID=A0AAG5D928_ANOAO
MSRFVISILFLLGLIGFIESVDYCELHCEGEPNVGCNPPPLSGGPQCFGLSARVVPITQALKSRILDRHNRHRSTLATGGLDPFPPARRMATLQWDAELASQAGHNVRSCIFEHDRCRDTEAFRWAGQNLAITRYFGQVTVESLIDRFIASWWNEHQQTSPDDIESYPSRSSAVIGHFTQMASDRTWKVGCAMQNWIEGGLWNTYYFACDYSFTNLIDEPVYVGGRTASGCTTGENTVYPGLCSTNEVVESVPYS